MSAHPLQDPPTHPSATMPRNPKRKSRTKKSPRDASSPAIPTPHRGGGGPGGGKTRGVGVVAKPVAKIGRIAKPSKARISNARIAEELRRIEKQEKELREEKERLARRFKVEREPLLPIEDFTRFRGATYSTWFRAQGSVDGARNWDAYDRMRNLLDEDFDEFSAPAAFFSQQIMGRVKWPGVYSRERIIETLNRIGGWEGDFRDIYPQWEYFYEVKEFIGGVLVRSYQYRAKQPLGKTDKRRGWKTR